MRLGPGRALRAVARRLGRIRIRILIVLFTVVLVPIAGLEFARLYERQLLSSLERDMRNQAVLTASMVSQDYRRGAPLDAPERARSLAVAAERTRTRIRILDEAGRVVADSHRFGPPEGPERPPPRLLSSNVYDLVGSSPARRPDWAPVEERREVLDALSGKPSARTRIRQADPAVLLFVSEPIHHAGRVVGAVYVVRSTQPVMVELYRIRRGLIQVLAVAFLIAALIALVLAWSIERPLTRLSRAAKRIARGEREVEVPVGGGGELRELGESFAAMTAELDARSRYIRNFAADVVHELKSPLTSIGGAAELLAEGAADDPEARARFLDNIRLDVDRLDRLVSRLLELSRFETSSEQMAPVDLAAVARRIAAREGTPDVRVEVEVEAGAGAVRGRASELEVALRNVVENAVRFSPPDGTVRVRLAPTQGGALRVTVRDAGPGIPEAHRERVFDRFFTTDHDRDGTGLGLSIVQTVVGRHGGTARALPADGEGACIEITLPCDAGGTTEAAAPRASALSAGVADVR